MPVDVITLDSIRLYGYPWKHPIHPPVFDFNGLHIALIHEYIWKKGCHFPGAPRSQRVSKFTKALEGYDVAVFGDNHIGFIACAGECEILNSGNLIRQKIDQRHYEPFVGLILKDGSIIEYYINTSKDKFRDVDPMMEVLAMDQGVDVDEFIDQLNQLGDTVLNFEVAIEQYMKKNKLRKGAKTILIEILEELK